MKETSMHSTNSQVFAELPVVSTPTGCYYSGISSISGLIWLPALTFELFLCLLVVWKAWGDVLIERLYRARGVSTATQFIPNMASQIPKLFSLFAQDRYVRLSNSLTGTCRMLTF